MSISVIIPTYNRRDLLARAVKSAIEQTLQPFEIIVVDDASDFDVGNYLDGIFRSPLIKLIRNNSNYGAAKSRNIGAEHASGEYIAFLDSDDYWDTHKLEKQMAVFKSYPQAVLVYCDQWVVKNDGTIGESGKKMIDKDILTHLLLFWTAPNTSTLVLKKSAFHEIGGFDNTLTSCQDHDLWMRIAIKGLNVAYTEERLSYFTQTDEDRISLNSANRLKGVENFLRKWEKDIIAIQGRKHFKWFRDTYKNNAALPIWLSLLKKRDFRNAARIYFLYLAANPAYYRRIFMYFFRQINCFCALTQEQTTRLIRDRGNF